MRAIVVTEHGGPEVLHPSEVPAPEPGAGQLAVEVAAAGVNYIDTYHRTGRYPTKPPFTPGVEVAGTVVAVGPGVTGFAAGDLVATADAVGGYAERALVNADRAIAVPAGADLRLAAAALLQGMTAHYLTHSTHPVLPGETVLVHAAAGGMGLLLTQLVKLRGGRVIGTVSTPEKERLAREAGADEVLGYDGFAEAVRDLTGGEGVAAVYDGVGRTTFDGSLAALRRRGVLALYGAASGPVDPVDPMRLAGAGGVYLTRPSLAHYTVTREELAERAGDVLRWVASGELKLHIGRTYPLADARTAHEDLEGRRTTGKLLLIP
ncbi:quinone oxidoreductase [Actinocorallia longicatena]|uniref:Quinone oxidoreductase n=1 Tax=Actinocorallia longicatena TaxID=111803 RepID=A0ABP6QSR2_9ACTN